MEPNPRGRSGSSRSAAAPEGSRDAGQPGVPLQDCAAPRAVCHQGFVLPRKKYDWVAELALSAHEQARTPAKVPRSLHIPASSVSDSIGCDAKIEWRDAEIHWTLVLPKPKFTEGGQTTVSRVRRAYDGLLASRHNAPDCTRQDDAQPLIDDKVDDGFSLRYATWLRDRSFRNSFRFRRESFQLSHRDRRR